MSELHRWTVRRAVAPLLTDARVAAPMTSQLIAGDVVEVLEARASWLRVRGSDAYEGWIHTGYVMPSTGDESTWRIAVNGRVRDTGGAQWALPVGARVAPDLTLVEGTAITESERAVQFPRDAQAIVVSASTLYAGASYLWGGVTPWGCDCSGFVQRVFALHGVALPRDAWQQAASVGWPLSDAVGDRAPGDLLFFSDREDQRVTHVGIALDADRMAHSALARGGFAIEDLRDDDAYVVRLRAQCVSIRRIV